MWDISETKQFSGKLNNSVGISAFCSVSAEQLLFDNTGELLNMILEVSEQPKA